MRREERLRWARISLGLEKPVCRDCKWCKRFPHKPDLDRCKRDGELRFCDWEYRDRCHGEKFFERKRLTRYVWGMFALISFMWIAVFFNAVMAIVNFVDGSVWGGAWNLTVFIALAFFGVPPYWGWKWIKPLKRLKSLWGG